MGWPGRKGAAGGRAGRTSRPRAEQLGALMNRTALGVAIGGGVLIALACLVLLSGGQSPSPNDGELERYRTETIVTLADGDRTVSSKVYTDCGVHYRRSFNTGGSMSVSASGRNPFVALGDRSILILSDLPGCPGTKAAVVGETYQFDVNIPSSQIVDRRIRAPYAHARRYDNVDDARTVMLYGLSLIHI